MSTKYSGVVDDVTSKPIQDDDIFLLSNNTGALTYDVSKRVSNIEFKDYVLAGVNIPTGNNVLFVAIGNGDDGTAAKGRRDLPYALLVTAVAAAVSGDIIIVEGTVVEAVTLKNGVDIIINGEWVYAGTLDGPVIGDNGVPVNCNITISGKFHNNNTNLGGGVGIKSCVSLSAASNVIISSPEISQHNSVTAGEFTSLFISGGANLTINGKLNGAFAVSGSTTLNVNGDVYLGDDAVTIDSNIISVGVGSNVHIKGNVTGDTATRDGINNSGTLEIDGDVSLSVSTGDVYTGIGLFRHRGNMTNSGSGECISATGGTIDHKGDIHSETGMAVILDGEITARFDGNISSNSQTAADTAITVKNNTTGEVTIRGNVNLTNANSTAGAILVRATTSNVHIYANVSSISGKVIISTQVSSGARIYGTVNALENASNAHPVVLENNGNNTCVLMSSCVLVATHSSAYGVSNDTNTAQQYTNYGAVSNRVQDPVLLATKVKSLLIDSNVI